jgi:hypothetical protein
MAGVLMATFLYVSPPVSTLQFDIDPGVSVQIDPSVHKSLSTNQVNGKTRVLIFALDTVEFSGRFATVSGSVTSITNVVGAKGDSTDAHAKVTKLSKIKSVLLKVLP